MKCKDCKYFTRYNDEPKYGVCDSGKIKYGLNIERNQETNDMLLYEDYEGYMAYHDVGEDFGCIHFKERGEPNE